MYNYHTIGARGSSRPTSVRFGSASLGSSVFCLCVVISEAMAYVTICFHDTNEQCFVPIPIMFQVPISERECHRVRGEHG